MFAALSVEAAAQIVKITQMLQEAQQKAEKANCLWGHVKDLRYELKGIEGESYLLRNKKAVETDRLKALRLQLAAEQQQRQEAETQILFMRRQTETMKREQQQMSQEICSLALRIRQARGETAKKHDTWQVAASEKHRLGIETFCFSRGRQNLERMNKKEKRAHIQSKRSISEFHARFKEAQRLEALKPDSASRSSSSETLNEKKEEGEEEELLLLPASSSPVT